MEKKGCSSCGKNKQSFPTMEFTKREKIYATIAVVIIFFTFYGMVGFVKDIISLF